MNKNRKKKKDEYVSPDQFCHEFFLAMGIGDSKKYRLDHYYDVSHEFLGMVANVMKLTMERMFA